MNEVQTYIKKQLKKGVRKPDIIEALKASGHEEEAAKQAVKETASMIKRLRILLMFIAIGLTVLLVFILGAMMNEMDKEEILSQEPLTSEEILSLAIQQQNSTLCQNLTGSLRTDCERQVGLSGDELLQEALLSGNRDLCQNLDGNQQTFCLEQNQGQEAVGSTSQAFEDAILSGDCSGFTGQELQFCQEQTQQQEPVEFSEDEQLLQEAILTGNASLCQELQGEMKAFCEEQTR